MWECAMSKFHEIRRPKSGGFVSFSKGCAFVLALRTLLRFLCRSHKEREKFLCIVYKVFRPSGVVGFREVGWQRCTGEISDVDVSRYRFFPEKWR